MRPEEHPSQFGRTIRTRSVPRVRLDVRHRALAAVGVPVRGVRRVARGGRVGFRFGFTRLPERAPRVEPRGDVRLGQVARVPRDAPARGVPEQRRTDLAHGGPDELDRALAQRRLFRRRRRRKTRRFAHGASRGARLLRLAPVLDPPRVQRRAELVHEPLLRERPEGRGLRDDRRVLKHAREGWHFLQRASQRGVAPRGGLAAVARVRPAVATRNRAYEFRAGAFEIERAERLRADVASIALVSPAPARSEEVPREVLLELARGVRVCFRGALFWEVLPPGGVGHHGQVPEAQVGGVHDDAAPFFEDEQEKLGVVRAPLRHSGLERRPVAGFGFIRAVLLDPHRKVVLAVQPVHSWDGEQLGRVVLHEVELDLEVGHHRPNHGASDEVRHADARLVVRVLGPEQAEQGRSVPLRARIWRDFGSRGRLRREREAVRRVVSHALRVPRVALKRAAIAGLPDEDDFVVVRTRHPTAGAARVRARCGRAVARTETAKPFAKTS